MLKCDQCENDAVYTQRDRSLLYITTKQVRLCGSCFSERVEATVFDNIESFEMIETGDRVLLCVSGEKDSTVMFHLVDKYVKTAKKKVEIFVLTVNEGISDYRARCSALVEEEAKIKGYTFIGQSYADVFDTTLDQIFAARADDGYRMCYYCCSLRGKIVKAVANEYNITKVATGMNLNDAVEHAMMCLMKGSIDQQSLPVYRPDGSAVSFISPIFNLIGIECGLYAHLNKIRILSEDCTYCEEHLRDDVGHSLNLLEDRNPGILAAFYHGYCRLAAPASVASIPTVELTSQRNTNAKARKRAR